MLNRISNYNSNVLINPKLQEIEEIPVEVLYCWDVRCIYLYKPSFRRIFQLKNISYVMLYLSSHMTALFFVIFNLFIYLLSILLVVLLNNSLSIMLYIFHVMI